MTRPRPRRAGFTLLELLIVVAIIAILSTLAAPSYVDRIVRAQIDETRGLAAFARDAVGNAWRLRQQLPRDNAEAGLPPADRIVGQYLQSAEVKDGALLLTFGNQASRLIAGRRLTLRPATVDDWPQVPVAWVCAGGEAPGPMTVHGADQTDVPARYLPFDCRRRAPAR